MLQENIFWLDVKKGGEEVEYSEGGPSILLEMSALEETAQLDMLCERAAGKYSPAWGPIYTLGNVDLEKQSLLLLLIKAFQEYDKNFAWLFQDFCVIFFRIFYNAIVIFLDQFLVVFKVF